ncbi:hypothetical protein AKO1_001588, partial [Acrasis kona]
ARFYNRRIQTQSDLRDRLRRRVDFTTNKAASRSSKHIILANVDALKYTIGLMIELDNSIRQKFDLISVKDDAEEFDLNESLARQQEWVSQQNKEFTQLLKEEGKQELVCGGNVGWDDEDEDGGADDAIGSCTIEEITSDNEDEGEKNVDEDSDSDELNLA